MLPVIISLGKGQQMVDNPLGGGGEGLLSIMPCTSRPRPKGVPFSGFRYIKEKGFDMLRYMKR